MWNQPFKALLLFFVGLTFSVLPALAMDEDCRKLTIAPSFEEGAALAKAQIEEICAKHPERGTVFVVIYGFPSSGKSVLITRLAAHFTAKGFHVVEEGSFAPGRKYYENALAFEAEFATDDPPQRILRLIHVTAPRGVREFKSETQLDPDAGVAEFFGRPADFHVAIFDSKARQPYQGQYDLQIANEKARR